MSRALLLGTAALLAAALLVPTASAQQYQVITTGSGAGLSADGSVAFGAVHATAGFVWDSVLTTYEPFEDVLGVAGDRVTLMSNAPNGSALQEGAWYDGDIWTGLGSLGASGCGSSLSSAKQMSDAGTIVGLGWDGCAAYPFRWDQGAGMSPLPLLGTSGRADCISHDGSLIGGHDTLNNRWRACIWDDQGNETILIDGVTNSNTDGVSPNGEAAVGSYGSEGWVWTELDGIVQIPRPASIAAGVGCLPRAVTNDGNMVVGLFGNLLGGVGFIWERGVGTSTAEDWFAAQGISIPDDVNSVMDVSADGRTFLANVGDLVFGFEVARIRLDGFENLGSSFDGTYGAPALYADGQMTLGTPINVNLGNALENATAFMVVGVAAINAPFYGGTLVPGFEAPLGTYLILFTDPRGEIRVPAVWPGGVPSGTDIFIQYWIDDPGAAFGLAGSNAVVATVP